MTDRVDRHPMDRQGSAYLVLRNLTDHAQVALAEAIRQRLGRGTHCEKTGSPRRHFSGIVDPAFWRKRPGKSLSCRANACE